MFNNMKVLILDQSQYLTHISDVSGLANLEKFSFTNCESLITIHNSVGYLIKLKTLNALNCQKLESFPPLHLPSLNQLHLYSCKSLKSFPELLCEMTNIEAIDIINTSIEELPISFKNLSKLGVLNISSVSLKILPECLDECHHLVQINMDGCTSLEEIRGFPPRLTQLSAVGCVSLSWSSRRWLLSEVCCFILQYIVFDI